MPTTSPTGASFLPGRLTRAQTRTVIAATVGAVLEWYDLLVYAMFAVVLAKQFFPASDPSVSLLLSLGTFALAWLVRPIGAVVIGGSPLVDFVVGRRPVARDCQRRSVGNAAEEDGAGAGSARPVPPRTGSIRPRQAPGTRPTARELQR